MISLTSPIETKAHSWSAGLKLALLCLSTFLLFIIDDLIIAGAVLGGVITLYVLPGTKFIEKSVYSTTYSDSISSKIKYKTNIKVLIDASDFLLTNNNQYRKSEAKKLAAKQIKSLLKLFPKRFGGNSYKDNFTFSVDVYIDYQNKLYMVADSSNSFQLKGYHSRW